MKLSQLMYLYERGTRIADQRFVETSGALHLGMPLGRFGEIRSGLRLGYVKSEVVNGQSPLDSFDGGLGLWETRLQYDLQDDPDFPHSGGEGSLVFLVSREQLGALDHYEKIVGTWTEFLSWKRSTGFWSVAAGSGFESQLPPQEQFLLGGFDSFAGYNRGEFRGNVLGTVRLGGYLELSNPIEFIGTQWYTGLWGDIGNVWPTQEAVRIDDLRFGGAAFFCADSIVGPAFVTGSLASGDAYSVYVTLGLQVGVQH